MDLNKEQPIVELYTAVQSEGSRAGYPTVIIRTTGCTHRCYFGEGGWCDSWYTSIHPEKGKFTLKDVIDIYEENPHIKEMMITGGSPTMHSSLLDGLVKFAKSAGIFTTIETEGSHLVKTPSGSINLLSISPKFSNSRPKLGIKTPKGKVVDEKMIKQHDKFRLNIEAIADMIIYHDSFHLKPVWDGEDLDTLSEILQFNVELAEKLFERGFGHNTPLSFIKDMIRENTWIMPAGDTREALFQSYPKVFDWVRDNGFKMTWRPHIIAFQDKREV